MQAMKRKNCQRNSLPRKNQLEKHDLFVVFKHTHFLEEALLERRKQNVDNFVLDLRVLNCKFLTRCGHVTPGKRLYIVRTSSS